MSATATNGNGKTKSRNAVIPASGTAADGMGDGPSLEGAPITQISVTRIPQERLLVPIVGTAPLVMHRFSEKARKQMLDNAQGVRTPKTPKDPEAEFEAAFYRLQNNTGFGFPADAFKQATVGAARFYGKSVSMTALKQFIFFRGQIGDDGRALVPILSTEEPTMREDVVRVGRGGTDLRYRPSFFPWTAVLEVIFFPSVITRDSVLSLIDAGGMAVGVGEWRPERDGTFGTFEVDPNGEIESVG